MSVSCTSSAGAVPRLGYPAPFSDSQVLLRNPKPDDLFWRYRKWLLHVAPWAPLRSPLVPGPWRSVFRDQRGRKAGPRWPPAGSWPILSPPPGPQWRLWPPAWLPPPPPPAGSLARKAPLLPSPTSEPRVFWLACIAPLDSGANSCPLHFTHSHGNLLPSRSKDGGGKWEFRALARNP